MADAPDVNVPALERLAQALQNRALEFGKFVQEQHPLMREGHFPRPGSRSPAGHARVGDRVVRRPERRPLRRAGERLADGRTDASNLHGLFRGELGKQIRKDADEQGLPASRRTDKEEVVGTGRGDLKGPPRAWLSAYLSEIYSGAGRHGRSGGGLMGWGKRRGGQQIRGGVETGSWIDPNPGGHGGLVRVFGGHDGCLHTGGACFPGDRQPAGCRP